MKINFLNSITDFGKGLIAGLLVSAVIFGLIMGILHHRNKIKEVVEYAEKQQAIEALREDYVNRDAAEFFEIPGVRDAADRAASEFERKRDEALQRIRTYRVDR